MIDTGKNHYGRLLTPDELWECDIDMGSVNKPGGGKPFWWQHITEHICHWCPAFVVAQLEATKFTWENVLKPPKPPAEMVHELNGSGQFVYTGQCRPWTSGDLDSPRIYYLDAFGLFATRGPEQQPSVFAGRRHILMCNGPGGEVELESSAQSPLQSPLRSPEHERLRELVRQLRDLELFLPERVVKIIHEIEQEIERL